VIETSSPERSVEIVVVTGMSGSGKSTAINALEDQGYYCIDNLPASLIHRFIGVCAESGDAMSRVGLGIDLRDVSYVATWPQIRRELVAAGHTVNVIFLDASNDVLLRRFSETRRSHPLARDKDLAEAVNAEREALNVLRESADVLVDTSGYTVHQLKARIIDTVSRSPEGAGPALTIRSFGYKYGAASDADLVFDVRFIPNPYFIETMRHLTGLDEDVSQFVLGREETYGFLELTMKLLCFLLPKYEAEGKSYLTIAMGCTGGQHRSVAIAEQLGRELSDAGFSVKVRHRDLDNADR
jgi:UPF0042 nucleotide-binding protein